MCKPEPPISKERIEEHHLLLDLTSHTPKLQQELHLFPQMKSFFVRNISPNFAKAPLQVSVGTALHK